MEFLTSNKKEILIGVVSGLFVAIILWLITLFNTLNLPPVQVPIWLIASLFTVPLVVYLLSLKPKKLKKISNETFGVERVFVDGKHFNDCTFDGSELVFKGTTGTSMQHCSLTATRFKFEGAAALTMEQLIGFYSDPGLRIVAETALNDVVKKGTEIHNSHSKS